MERFKGKTALITGETTVLGLATANLSIKEGARVIVTGRTPFLAIDATFTTGAELSVDGSWSQLQVVDCS